MIRHAEAIELAARLQEEERHEEALLRAAEAGIEPRHVREALARLGAPAQTTVPVTPVALALAGFVSCCFWLAYYSWTPRERLLAAFGWGAAFVVMMAYNKPHYGQFFMAPAEMILMAVLQCALATTVAAWASRRARGA